MTFTDDLTLVLDLLVLVTVALFYTGLLVFIQYYRKDLDRANSNLKEGSAILGIVGAIILIIALWGEFTWPIPPAYGAYDSFFFDPLALLGVILIAFWYTVWTDRPTHYVGIISAVSGCGIIFYGIRAYQIGLTEDPLETLLLYLGFGALAIGAYPMTLFVDWFISGPKHTSIQPLPSGDRPDYPRMWIVLIAIFLAIIVITGVAALFYGFDSAWGHLANPP